MTPCLTLSIIKCTSRVKWSNQRKVEAPFPTPRCSSYWMGSLWFTHNYDQQLYLLIYTSEESINKLLTTVVKGYPKAPFSMATEREDTSPFPGLLHFTLETYLIMLSVKQGGIKYHFLSLWYDLTWDWTPVSQAIGEHSTTKPITGKINL